MLGMWDVKDLGCWDFVGCWGYGMFGMWNVQDVECLCFRMFLM